MNDNLCVEGWYEESIFTEAHTVKSDEPVGRRDDLRDHRYLGDHCRDHDRDLSSTNHAVVCINEDIGRSVPNPLHDRRSQDGVQEAAIAGRLVQSLRWTKS